MITIPSRDRSYHHPFPRTGRCPFSGPGVNCHNSLIPVADCATIAITWFRCEADSVSLTAANVDARLAWYGASNVLWLVTQYHPIDTGLAQAQIVYARMKAAGVTNPRIEIYNEPSDPGWSVGAISAGTYAATTHTWRALMPDAIFFGPASGGTPLPARYANDIMLAGADIDVITDHGGYRYSYNDLPGYHDSLSAAFSRDVLQSEMGRENSPSYSPTTTDNADYYVKYHAHMGTRPWAYYVGPGDLFTGSDGNWSQSAVFTSIQAQGS